VRKERREMLAARPVMAVSADVPYVAIAAAMAVAPSCMFAGICRNKVGFTCCFMI